MRAPGTNLEVFNNSAIVEHFTRADWLLACKSYLFEIEVVRADPHRWKWPPEICTYQEGNWTVETVAQASDTIEKTEIALLDAAAKG